MLKTRNDPLRAALARPRPLRMDDPAVLQWVDPSGAELLALSRRNGRVPRCAVAAYRRSPAYLPRHRHAQADCGRCVRRAVQ